MKEKYEKLKETEKGRTLIKFSGYMIFLFLVILMIIISGATKGTESINNTDNSSENSHQSEEVEKEITYLDMQKALYEGDYEFSYKISGELEINYIGEKKGEIISGYKETKDNLVKYQIEDDKIYKIVLKEKTEYEDLYLGLDAKLFDFKNIFETLNPKNAIIEKTEKDKSYIYENIDNYKYIIKLNDKEITNIIIETKDLNYNFEFIY